MRKLMILSFLVLVGCNAGPRKSCPQGQRYFHCTVNIDRHATMCGCEYDISQYICAPNQLQAIDEAQRQADVVAHSVGGVATVKNCDDTGTGEPGLQSAPVDAKLQPQTFGAGGGAIPVSSCDSNPQDNVCKSCAKVYCCADYQTCMGDITCKCWADCLASGGGQNCAVTCGAPDMVATSTAACLQGVCASVCEQSACMCSSM